MKDKNLKLFLIPLMMLLLMFLPVSVSADTKSSDGQWYYNKLSDSTVEITGYLGSSTTLKVPNTIDDLTVVKIGDKAFSRSTKITAIVIPDTVNEIGSEAFANSYNLRAISVPKSVSVIGKDAFLNTPYLTSLYNSAIDGVTYINTIAIHFDNSKTNVSLKHGTTDFGTIFKDATNLVSITIPSTVTKIEDFAFLGCNSLRYVIIPDSVYDIGSAAFLGINQNVLTICSNSSSYARTYAIEYGFRYDAIPSSAYLFNSYVQYDKYATTDLSIQFYPGDGIKKVSSITKATIQSSSNYNSNTTNALTLEANLVLGGSYNNNYIIFPNSTFANFEKGLYIITIETNIGDKLICSLNLVDNLPTGNKPYILSQSKTFDIYKPDTIKYTFNLGTYASKATTINAVTVNGTKIAEDNYTIKDSEITFSQDYLSKLAVGTYKIVVTFDDKAKTEVADKLTLVIKNTEPTEVEPTNIVLNKNIKDTCIGGYYTLKATITPSNATKTKITWVSSNDNIATIDVLNATQARVYFHKAGVVMVTATDENGHQDRCFFVVKEAPKVSKTKVSLAKGKSTTVKFTNKYSWADVTVKTSNSKVAVATKSGKITAKGKGTATITWVINQCGKKYTVTTKVTVK